MNIGMYSIAFIYVLILKKSKNRKAKIGAKIGDRPRLIFFIRLIQNRNHISLLSILYINLS